ncbi:uncharacterized protein LOC113512740 [Galleria mellonella]|uniref:Uncharacterized protein LOC113512740 n=1 Tax=Galleria mellonella TaxID=7137 RepID=A0A6J1WFZ9_GALME|nr:uncharacterized protein LOC113512740 [Galleria mellonella]
MLQILTLMYALEVARADLGGTDLQFLNELPLEKLLVLKSSLQEFVSDTYQNTSTSTPSYLESFGAQAMAIKAPPIKRTDYEEMSSKKDSKISKIFSMSVTTLAFLAFGGYLLCLIVQAVREKQNYAQTTAAPATFFVSAGIKKRPQQFVSYGRRKRESGRDTSSELVDIPSEQLFSALLQICEGYAKWSERYADSDTLY